MISHVTDGIGWREWPGTGVPLICLHGIGSDALSFDALAAALAQERRVIAWDAPGYGESVDLAGDWPEPDDYAEALLRLLDAIDLSQVHVLGHSLGTLIGASFAAHHPDRITGLTLVSCAQGMGMPKGGPLPEKAADRLADLERLGAKAFAHTRASRLVHDPVRHSDLVARIEGAMARIRTEGYSMAVRMLARGDLATTMAGVTVPTDIIVGAEDFVTPPDQSRAAWVALPATARRRFHLLPGIGHAVPQQAPDDLARIVAAAMNREQEETA